MEKRELTELEDLRLVYRGNKILRDLFGKSVHSIRQIASDESGAKGFYRFLQNDRVSEDDIVANLVTNCKKACRGKFVVCLQDSTEINLNAHCNRIKKDGYIGTTNANKDAGLGFFLHPSLVVDGNHCIPYGYSDIKIWSRSLSSGSKSERGYKSLSIEEKESYKWIEVSRNTQSALAGIVEGIVIVQDREGDIYEQFAVIPDERTDLLIRARADRTLADQAKLFSCLSGQQAQGTYEIAVPGTGKTKKKECQNSNPV